MVLVGLMRFGKKKLTTYFYYNTATGVLSARMKTFSIFFLLLIPPLGVTLKTDQSRVSPDTLRSTPRRMAWHDPHLAQLYRTAAMCLRQARCLTAMYVQAYTCKYTRTMYSLQLLCDNAKEAVENSA